MGSLCLRGRTSPSKFAPRKWYPVRESNSPGRIESPLTSPEVKQDINFEVVIQTSRRESNPITPRIMAALPLCYMLISKDLRQQLQKKCGYNYYSQLALTVILWSLRQESDLRRSIISRMLYHWATKGNVGQSTKNRTWASTLRRWDDTISLYSVEITSAEV